MLPVIFKNFSTWFLEAYSEVKRGTVKGLIDKSLARKGYNIPANPEKFPRAPFRQIIPFKSSFEISPKFMAMAEPAECPTIRLGLIFCFFNILDKSSVISSKLHLLFVPNFVNPWPGRSTSITLNLLSSLLSNKRQLCVEAPAPWMSSKVGNLDGKF